jgi:hypothetical protein
MGVKKATKKFKAKQLKGQLQHRKKVKVIKRQKAAKAQKQAISFQNGAF